jgi:hypothetical protein
MIVTGDHVAASRGDKGRGGEWKGIRSRTTREEPVRKPATGQPPTQSAGGTVEEELGL